jgi:hypothetical protein
LVQKRGEKGRGGILIAMCLVHEGMGGMIKSNYFFILIILLEFHNFKIIRYINIKTQ